MRFFAFPENKTMKHPDFQKMKAEGQKISVVTVYDYTSAKIVNSSQIDCLLVGDSLGMTMHGFRDTLSVTTELMAIHTAAVSRGAPDKFIVADMPFLTFRKGIPAALDCVTELVRAGAHAVKLEGVDGHEDVIRAIVESGVPVMGHLGMTPQSIHQLGGYRIQAKTIDATKVLLNQALRLEKAGCFAMVLELMSTKAAREVSRKLRIPTIGIGAGPDTDGQVLVFQDVLGLNPDFNPRFVRRYLKGAKLVGGAIDNFHTDVRSGAYPSAEESYP